MGGANNSNALENIANPISLVFSKENAWWADPMGGLMTQSLQNTYNWATGKEHFGTHRNWFGGDEKNMGNTQMRKWLEGDNYKNQDIQKGIQEQRRQQAIQILADRSKPKGNTPISVDPSSASGGGSNAPVQDQPYKAAPKDDINKSLLT